MFHLPDNLEKKTKQIGNSQKKKALKIIGTFSLVLGLLASIAQFSGFDLRYFLRSTTNKNQLESRKPSPSLEDSIKFVGMTTTDSIKNDISKANKEKVYIQEAEKIYNVEVEGDATFN